MHLNLIRTAKYAAAALLAVSTLVISSCGEDEEPAIPTITDLSPTSGVAGTSVTISGTNFKTELSANAVEFNGETAMVTAATKTELTVTVPEAATTGKVTVTIGGKTATSASDFTILSPTITSFSPSIGSEGISVVITGTNFSTEAGFNIVKFNATQGTVTNATETELTVTVPAAATTGKITVKVGPNTATSADNFEICSSSAELILSNVVITEIELDRAGFTFTVDITNVGTVAADITKMVAQGYISTDNVVGSDLAASGYTLSSGPSALAPGETYTWTHHSNILDPNTVDSHPFVILNIHETSGGAVPECNTANNTIIAPIL